MSSRYIRDTAILAKIEAVYGTDPVPTGAANAMLVKNVKITPLNAQTVPRDLLRSFFGASEELIASYNKLVTFDIEAVGSGTAGTAPAYGPLLRACGWAETLVVAERVEYAPITNNQESVTFYVYDSGVLHKMLGAKGAVSFNIGLGGIPTMSFSFVALDGGDTAVATPGTITTTGFKVPQVVQDAFTGDLTLGGTLTPTPGTPAITAGTTYPSMGLEVDSGVVAEFIDLLSSQTVEITDRKVKGKIKVDATAAQEVAFYSAVKDGTLQSVGLIHGTVVGRRFGLFGASAQILMPSKEEIKGKRLIGLDVIFMPTVAGNDELKVITSF